MIKKLLTPNRYPWFFCISLVLLAISLWPTGISTVTSVRSTFWGIDPPLIADLISEDIAANHFPSNIVVPDFPISGELAVRYTIDKALQKEVKRLLRRYNPDYGLVVALDPDTGRVLAMASSARNKTRIGDITTISRYPAASISKVVTAVAAMNENKIAGNTIVPFNGKPTSLYKKNVFRHRNNKWTRKYSFGKSFARSVNSVFARVGAVNVGGETMLDYAERLGFNGSFASDVMFENSTIKVDTEDTWQVAEMASGYTMRNTLSPLHGAVLAATAVNGGKLVTPMVVEEIIGPNGVPLYWNEQPTTAKVMSETTAHQLQKMMSATVTNGSARPSFIKFHRGYLKNAVVGGKTGSLTGLSPKGRYDWFIGFGTLGERKIAYAALCVNQRIWYVKSAQLAREILEFYFRNPPTTKIAANSYQN